MVTPAMVTESGELVLMVGRKELDECLRWLVSPLYNIIK